MGSLTKERDSESFFLNEGKKGEKGERRASEGGRGRGGPWW